MSRPQQWTVGIGVVMTLVFGTALAVKQAYQATGVPESWVINRDGVIVKKVVGPSEWDAPVNEGLIRRLIDERAQ